MKILIGCEFSGIVRDAFIAMGHDAMSCDLLPTERPGPHYQGDVADLLAEPWDMGIFHPPCTYLCSSGLHWNRRRPERAALTEQAIAFARQFIDGPETAHIPHRVVENPTGCLSTRVRPYDQLIQPWQFGEDASKSTCLWLFGVRRLEPTNLVPPRQVCCGRTLTESAGKYGCPNCHGEHTPRPRWGNQTDSGQNRLSPSAHRWKDRSTTYPGIAFAMAQQWGNAAASRMAA